MTHVLDHAAAIAERPRAPQLGEPAAPAHDLAARVGRATADVDRGVVSAATRRRPCVRAGDGASSTCVLLVLLVIVALGPLLWLAKSAITPTQDTLRTPDGVVAATGSTGRTCARRGSTSTSSCYFFNTVRDRRRVRGRRQMVVATTGGFVLSILRPRYGASPARALVLVTLFVPAVVLLVPLYLTVLDLPLVHRSLINIVLGASWLPAGASAFNVVLVKRFFDNLPREIFEAATVDGAGPFRLFWSVVLPMSRPILGVVSVFAVLAAWKDFLWPLLVLPDPAKQPLSVRLPTPRSR